MCNAANHSWTCDCGFGGNNQQAAFVPKFCHNCGVLKHGGRHQNALMASSIYAGCQSQRPRFICSSKIH
jgi:hypothetical protein